jgi:signal transduction histidine kinase
MAIKNPTCAPTEAAANPLAAAAGMPSGASTNVAFLNVKFNADPESIAANASNVNAIFNVTQQGADGQVRNLSPIVTAAAIDDAGIAQALRDSREELRRLSGLLISIQEDERRRIALDLHDGLGQSISLIKLSIEKAAVLLAAGATSEAGESLRQLLPRVEEALVDVRRVSTELRPLMLDDLGIMPTLSWFFREFEAACGGIVVERAFNVAESDVPVPLHITLYRILQEALHNIVKHSGADRVRVCLERIDDVLHLVIEDNGRGFDPDSVKCVEGQTRGLGLLSMKERASFSGATYFLTSVPGKGTCIKVLWSASTCPANVDCCRASECSAKQPPCRAKPTQYDGPENTVHCV